FYRRFLNLVYLVHCISHRTDSFFYLCLRSFVFWEPVYTAVKGNSVYAVTGTANILWKARFRHGIAAVFVWTALIGSVWHAGQLLFLVCFFSCFFMLLNAPHFAITSEIVYLPRIPVCETIVLSMVTFPSDKSTAYALPEITIYGSPSIMANRIISR